MNVLIVEDDRDTLNLIQQYFKKENMETYCFHSFTGVLETINAVEIDLCILDVMIGNDNGFDLLKEIKDIKDIPIIFVTGKSDEYDRIYGIEIGADDYLTKPFSPRELIARSKRLLKRTQGSEVKKETLLRGKNITIDTGKRLVENQGEEVVLTLKEYETLVYFVKNPEIALSRDQVIEGVWGFDALGQTRMVDDIVKRLRKKLDINIETIWGVGYKYHG